MPVYQYNCKKCGYLELTMPVDDRDNAKCPKCKKKIDRIFSYASNIAFKGSGFYCTDSNPKPLEQKISSTETKSSKESSLNKGKVKRNV